MKRAPVVTAPAPADHDPGDVIGTPEVCRRAMISRETLRRWRARGCPHFKVSAHLFRYQWGSILQWMNQETKK